MKDTIKGLFGMAAVSAGGAASRWEAIKPALQVISLMVGIIVAVLTGVSVGLTIYWKLKHYKRNE